MPRPNNVLAAVAFALCCLFTSLAHAVASQRTFVASYGTAANTAFNCSIAKPCRAFSEALSVTFNGGEIIVLDSSGYGPVTITQSVSIIAPPGVYAGITVFSGDGVTINAPSGNYVLLRGLTINGLGGQNGITFTSGQNLHIHDCVVSNMFSNGIQLKASGANVLVTGTLVRENQQSGIYLEGAQTAVLDAVRAEGNLYGVYARSGPMVTIRNSIAVNSYGTGGGFNLDAETANTTMTVSNSVSSNNFGYGVLAQATAFSGRLTVERSLMQDNGGAGVRLNGPLTIALLAGNVIRRSQDCIQIVASAFAYTRGDNTVFDCPSNVTGGALTLNSPL